MWVIFFSHIRAILFSFQEVVLHITNHDKEISVYFWSSYSRVVIGMKGNSIAEIIHYQRTEKPPKCWLLAQQKERDRDANNLHRKRQDHSWESTQEMSVCKLARINIVRNVGIKLQLWQKSWVLYSYSFVGESWKWWEDYNF